ncbi:hemicentin-1-like isoform X1 [Mya arenaria]|uniref:hemicentin-1-like isoform X1 n=1 Tax=Mya arenaria TaxID=6604 RepID=UPI0022E8D277|nr:hemicentin-1-like isoform X1 [Mya arenaria]
MCVLKYSVVYTCFVNVYFGYFSEAAMLNLTYTPSPALENSPVTLTCSYTGLQTTETTTRAAWDVKAPNDAFAPKGTIKSSSCTPFGVLDTSLYNFSCGVGYFTWTILNVSRNNDQHVWQSTIGTTVRLYIVNTTLNVQVPITAVSMAAPTDSTVTMNAGDSETFKCRTSGGLPQATIKWFKVTGNTCSQSGTEIKSSVFSPTVSVVEGLKQVESTLTFTATGTDNGLRICCIASNVEGKQRESGTKLLDVRYAPTDSPVIEGYASGSKYSMIENSTESLTCISTGGNPLATLTWSCFNGQMSSPSEQGSTVKRVVQWSARRNENARCTCTASHVTRQNQSQSAFVNVNVLYPPSTPIFRVGNTDVGSSISIITNSSQTVECTSFGNPPPASSDFTWRKGTIEMSTHSVLNWPGGIKVGDEGSYTCTVETTMTPSNQSNVAQVATSSSTVKITVLYPPELPTLYLGSRSGPVILGPLTLVVQRSFTLVCDASSKPPANFSWAVGVNTVQGQLLQDMLATKVNTMRTCTASSTLNPTVGPARTMSSSATVTININYFPENVLIRHESVSGTAIQSEFRVIEGNATKLYCSVQSQPASSFSWSGADIHSLGSNLVYSNTLQAQTGVLSCLAENNMTHGNQAVKGSASRNISLNVLYPPKLLTLHRINAVEGRSLLIQCQYTDGNPIATTLTITRTADGTSWSGKHTIQSVRRADAGLYRCTVNNSMDPTGEDIRTGMDTADFEINVWYNTSITRFEVSGNPNQTIVTINESDRFVVVCGVLSNPNSTIRLEKNNMATTLLKTENVLEVEYLNQNAVCSDADVYTCSGFNNYTDMNNTPSKELQLFVRCSPRPSDSHEHLRRNFTGTVHGNVTFAFMAVAYPPPTFEWQMWNETSYNKVNGDKYVITSTDLLTSLTIVNIQLNDFMSYILKVSNGIHPYLQEPFYLNPHGVPQCPTNFTLLAKSTTMATVQWKGEFNGGLQQTFVVVYKKRSDSIYFNLSKPEDKETEIYNTELTDLEDGQLYDVILYSQNMIGPCIDNKSLVIKTDTEENAGGISTAVIGGVAGGSSAVILIGVGVLIVILYRRRFATQTKETHNTLTKGQKLSHFKDKHADSDSDDGIPDEVENPMYESSPIEQQKVADAIYAMPKKKKGDVYAAVNKKKKKNDHPAPAAVSMSHDNAAFDIYENNQPTPSKQGHMNKDGLLYADIVFANPPKGQRKLVIHGLDDMTTYAEVDLTKTADPLPDSDNEINKKS